MNSLDWQQDAACRDIGFAVFTPDDDTSSSAAGALYREARPVCTGCPVREACLDFAIDMEGAADRDERSGMYGGLAPHERYAVYLQRRHQTAA